MDLLLSLPIVSFFLAPTMTSWSTSLNLLFFYLTWSTLILSHSPLKVEILGVAALRIVLWLVPSLAFLLFDLLVPSLSKNIKHNGASALPPSDASTLLRILGLALCNLGLEVGAEAGISFGLAALLKTPSVFRTTTTLPLPWGMIKHIVFLLAARELLGYYIHRFLLHQPPRGTSSPPGGRALANMHRRFAHARPAPPFALARAADHPLAFLLHRFVPVYLPALLIHGNLHLLTYFIFVAICTGEETLAMSGYSVVPGIIMGGIARRTAIHYAAPRGNYGAWGFVDWAHGTSLGGDVMGDVRDEAEKHHLKERGEKAAGNAGSMLQDGIKEVTRQARSRGRRSRNSERE